MRPRAVNLVWRGEPGRGQRHGGWSPTGLCGKGGRRRGHGCAAASAAFAVPPAKVGDLGEAGAGPRGWDETGPPPGLAWKTVCTQTVGGTRWPTESVGDQIARIGLQLGGLCPAF